MTPLKRFLPVAVAMMAIGVGQMSSGCMHNVPLDITKSGRESILPADLSLPNVRLTTKLATLEDVVAQMGSTFNVHSGKIFRKVFTGDESAPVHLDLVNSSMVQGLNNVMLIASKTNVTYSASVVLVIGDEKHILFSTATASTAWTIDRAAREAVERVVIDLAMQAKVHIEAQKKEKV